MTHLEEGRIRALLDDELDAADGAVARSHLASCDECARLRALMEARGTKAREAIAVLDVPAPTITARATVMERVHATDARAAGVAPPERPPAVFAGLSLQRAAVIALLLIGAAAALPGSAVRAWMVSGWRAAVELVSGGSEAVPVAVPSVAPTLQEVEPAGIRFDVTDEPLRVVLDRIDAGSLVVVRFVEGVQASFNGSDARFRRTADGRFEVTGGSGTIRIDVPRTVVDASLRVNGRIYLTLSGDRVEAAGPVETRSLEEISFRVR